MYGFQHRALAHTQQQAIKGPKITSVKPIKRENQQSNLYKKNEEMRNMYMKIEVYMFDHTPLWVLIWEFHTF